MPPQLAAPVLARTAAHERIPSVVCAAYEYTQIAAGLKDYTLYYRLLPWDHAPGALLVREAGGVVRHPSGRDYELFDSNEATLLAPDESTWRRARNELFA